MKLFLESGLWGSERASWRGFMEVHSFRMNLFFQFMVFGVGDGFFIRFFGGGSLEDGLSGVVLSCLYY